MGKSMRETENDIVDLNARELRSVLRLMRKQMKQMDDLVKNCKVESFSDADEISSIKSETKEMYNILSSKLPKLYD